MPTCLSKQNKLPTNSPISSIFNFWPRDMSRSHIQTFRQKKTFTLLLGKNYFVLGLLARDIANRSFVHTFDPGLKHFKWKID